MVPAFLIFCGRRDCLWHVDEECWLGGNRKILHLYIILCHLSYYEVKFLQRYIIPADFPSFLSDRAEIDALLQDSL